MVDEGSPGWDPEASKPREPERRRPWSTGPAPPAPKAREIRPEAEGPLPEEPPASYLDVLKAERWAILFRRRQAGYLDARDRSPSDQEILHQFERPPARKGRRGPRWWSWLQDRLGSDADDRREAP